MLLLTFRAAENLYAIDVARVVEVVPRINLRRLPHAPDYLAGVFDYRGKVVPVVDLGILLGSESCRDQLSTRIILVNSRSTSLVQAETLDEAAGTILPAATASGTSRDEPLREHRRWLLGLIAEQVSDVSSVKPEQIISASIELPQTPYLGAIVEIDQEMVQLIAVDRVLQEPLRRSFFGPSPTEDRESISDAKAEAGLL